MHAIKTLELPTLLLPPRDVRRTHDAVGRGGAPGSSPVHNAFSYFVYVFFLEYNRIRYFVALDFLTSSIFKSIDIDFFYLGIMNL